MKEDNPLREDTSQVSGTDSETEVKKDQMISVGYKPNSWQWCSSLKGQWLQQWLTMWTCVSVVFQDQAAKWHLCQLGGHGALPPLLPHPISKWRQGRVDEGREGELGCSHTQSPKGIWIGQQRLALLHYALKTQAEEGFEGPKSQGHWLLGESKKAFLRKQCWSWGLLEDVMKNVSGRGESTCKGSVAGGSMESVRSWEGWCGWSGELEVEVSGEVGRARPCMKELCLCSKYNGK